MKKSYILLVLILCFNIIQTSCVNSTKSRLNCICLIDYSGSLSKETMSSYSSIITETIFKNLGEVDQLIVIPIDEGAKTQSIRIVYEDLSNLEFSKSSDGFTHKQDSITKRIQNYVSKKMYAINNEIIAQKELRSKFTNKTDIISALEQVQVLLEQPKKSDFWMDLWMFISGKIVMNSDNAIIIFSDMIQESDDYDFTRILSNNSHKFEEVLENLKSQQRIPNFYNCSIFVDGRTGKNNLQVESIKNFWISYFKLSQGNVIAYDYDCSKEIEHFLQNRRELNDK